MNRFTLKALGLFHIFFCSTATAATCPVQVSVRDPHGLRIKSYEISKVSFGTDGQHASLAGLPKVDSSQSRILVDARQLPLLLSIELRRKAEYEASDREPPVLVEKVVVKTCNQRFSVIAAYALIDGWSVPATGKLVGCVITEDHWVRAISMFRATSIAFDAAINSAGEFEVMLPAKDRYIFILGEKGRVVRTWSTYPEVKVTGIDLGTVSCREQPGVRANRKAGAG